MQLEDWTAKLTKLEVLLKLTGKFVYMYNNVLLILSTVTTLTCSQSTILEFPCRRMVQVCHLKSLLCLGTNFYTNYCCFLVCIWDMQLKRVCVENCRKLLHCWQVNVVLFIHSFIHSFIYLFIYLSTNMVTLFLLRPDHKNWQYQVWPFFFMLWTYISKYKFSSAVTILFL